MSYKSYSYVAHLLVTEAIVDSFWAKVKFNSFKKSFLSDAQYSITVEFP